MRRIPLHKLIDLKVDFAFKQLFGSERNKHITIVFLNAILARTGRDTIKEVTFLNEELGGQYDGDKQSRLDLLVKTQSGEHINIEMQLSNQDDMMKRTLYYWSRLFAKQLEKGKGYRTLLPTITINICNFTVFNDLSHYHTTYHLYEDAELKRLRPIDDVLEVHFIEMNKFLKAWHDKKLQPLDDILARWLLLLGMVDARKEKVYTEIYEELEELAMKDENLIDAFGTWEELSQTPETRFAYEMRLKAIIDDEARLSDAKDKGIELGEERGIEKGIEIGKAAGRHEERLQLAKNFLALHVELETIQQATGLSIDELEKLKRHM
ncbi:hypothetical protein A6K76_02630 [Caryophanon latum]|uniref:Transposase n=1 Tax=Caryophanon latum TaxID=33977 RepID=A0A1C0YJI6_9BACL|nr:hypothetical protein A6K76_02630 [Caryophanon latum]